MQIWIFITLINTKPFSFTNIHSFNWHFLIDTSMSDNNSKELRFFFLALITIDVKGREKSITLITPKQVYVVTKLDLT